MNKDILVKMTTPAVAALGLVFMIGATNISAPANAKETAISAERKCQRAPGVKAALRDLFGAAATGEKGKDSQFNLEIYANDTGFWALVGSPLVATPEISADELCLLATGTNGYPDEVHQYYWYKQYFHSAPRKQI